MAKLNYFSQNSFPGIFLPSMGHQRHFAWVRWVEERQQALGCSPVSGWGWCLCSSQAFPLTCWFMSFICSSSLATGCSIFPSILLQRLSVLDEVSIKRHDKGHRLSLKNTHFIKVGGNENWYSSSPMFVGSCPRAQLQLMFVGFSLFSLFPTSRPSPPPAYPSWKYPVAN